MFFTSWLTALLRERKRNTNPKAATCKRFYHRTGCQQIDLLEDRTMLSAVAPRDLPVEAHAEDPQESATESEFAVSLSSDYRFDFQNSVTVANNNTYKTGTFQGIVDFDPGPGVFNLTPTAEEPDYDVLLLKLDSGRDFLWAKNVVTAHYRHTRITIDHADNVYTNGAFVGTKDFDPGAGTFNLTAEDSRSHFIQKLDSSGNFISAEIQQYSHSAFTFDATGNIYVTGSFSGTS